MKLRNANLVTRIWLFLWLFASPLAYAHDPGLSTATMQREGGAIIVRHAFSPADVQLLVKGGGRSDQRIIGTDISSLRPQLLTIAAELWEVSTASGKLVNSEKDVAFVQGDNLEFRLRFDPVREGVEYQFLAKVFEQLPMGHRVFVVLKDESGKTNSEWLLSPEKPSFKSPLATSRSSSRFSQFLALGVEHIWTGYDHLLFLLGLLIVCRDFRAVIKIVSCFTLAHSLTLAGATLGWVNASSRWVEPLIALSIVFIGAENLWLRGREPKSRGYLTFGFGLIHGFGFASVLKDLGVGSSGSSIALPLFAFNLGVEVGQLAVAAIALPIIWQLRKNPRFEKRGAIIISCFVVLLGTYWFVERIISV